MHRNFVETIILGIAIGIGVVIVRLLTVHAGFNPWILLGVVAVVLSVLQIVFIMIRRRSGAAPRSKPQEMQTPTPSHNGMPVSSVVQRANSSDIFARELDHNWTGLETTDDSALSSPLTADTPSSLDIDTPSTDKALEQEYPRSYS